MLKKTRIMPMVVIFLMLFALANISSAYVGKYYYSLTSGMLSHWANTDFAVKLTNSEKPVVSSHRTYGATNTFKYRIINSNDEPRTNTIIRTGTFGLRPFDESIAKRGYKYRLSVKRDGAQFWDSATTEGYWNLDSYR